MAIFCATRSFDQFYRIRPDFYGSGRDLVLAFGLPDSTTEVGSSDGLVAIEGFGSNLEVRSLNRCRLLLGPPRDLEPWMDGQWIVSERLYNVMKYVDEESFSFSKLRCYQLDDGSVADYYICNVTRTVDALDEDASRLGVEISDYDGEKYYRLLGQICLRFKREALGSISVFKLPFHGAVFCDVVFKDAVEETGRLAGRPFSGISFERVTSSFRAY
ncbi:imm11 family protein [Stenotrophomonas maltophilia]|uniref:imm11 family protein n=1 Tax=Stenotrophomonas maltophilia TaxID=40324 RepID=UPI003D7F1085